MTISKRFVFNVLKKHKKRFFLAQIFVILAVTASIPLPLVFAMLVDEVILGEPKRLTLIIDVFASPTKIQYVFIVLGLVIALRLLYYILSTTSFTLFTQIAKKTIYEIRQKIISHLQKVKLSEYEILNSSGMSAKLITDMNTLDEFITTLISKSFVMVFTIIGVMCVMVFISPKLTIILFLFNPIVIVFSFYLSKKVRRLKKEENLSIESFQGAMSETLDLFSEIRTHNREASYMGSLMQKAKDICVNSTNFAYKSQILSSIGMFSFFIGFEIFRATAVIFVVLDDLTIGQMVAVTSYLWFIADPIFVLLGIIFSYQSSKAAVSRLNEILTLSKESSYKKISDPFGKDAPTIELRGINFAYASKTILHSLDLVAQGGKTTAIVGASGAGKTTVAQIIVGLYEPTAGDILVDGVSYKKISLEYMRENICLVLQNTKMFNDTLRANIALGKDLSDDEIMHAINISQLRQLFSTLPDGLETKIGKDGVRLSGGERQRISIARMLVRNANVVIFDESTSALDVHTEKRIFSNMQDFLQNKTKIIITHRLESIKNADLIYNIENGKAKLTSFDELDLAKAQIVF